MMSMGKRNSFMNHNTHIFLIDYFRVRDHKVLSSGALVFILLSEDNNIYSLSINM